MPECVNCRFYDGEEGCSRRIVYVNPVTGKIHTRNCFEERSWGFGRCGSKAKYFEPAVPTIAVQYVPDEDKVTEIAALLIERSGFNDQDAVALAKEIIKIWVEPVHEVS